MMGQNMAVVGASRPTRTVSPHERYESLQNDVMRRLFAGCVVKEGGGTIVERPLTLAEREVVLTLEAERVELGRRLGIIRY